MAQTRTALSATRIMGGDRVVYGLEGRICLRVWCEAMGLQLCTACGYSVDPIPMMTLAAPFVVRAARVDPWQELSA